MLRRHTWQRSPKPPILGRHPIFPTPQPLFKVYPTPHPTFPVTSNAHPHCPFCCLVSLAEWVIAPHLMCIYLMVLWIYKCHAMAQLYQKDFYVWLMQQGITFTEVWHRMRFFVGTLIWYHTHKHTNAHKTMHSTLRASRLHTHIYIYIYTHCYVLKADLLHFTTLNERLILKTDFPQCVSFSKIIHL